MVDAISMNSFFNGWMMGWSLVVILFLKLILDEIKNKKKTDCEETKK